MLLSRKQIRAIFCAIITILSTSVPTITVAAADSISNVDTTTAETFDRDEDRKYSNFKASIHADMRVGGLVDQLDTFFRVYVNEKPIRTVADIETGKDTFQTITLSRNELSHIDSESVSIIVELVDDVLVTHTDTIEGVYKHTHEFDLNPKVRLQKEITSTHRD